ncbi:MAG: hypothetical protein QM765_31415 [Myxococcales bacterium]
MCPSCELVVDGAQVERAPLPPHEPSLVFALLAPADAKLEKAPGPPPPPREAFEDSPRGCAADEDEPTVLFRTLPNPLGVPIVVGKLDGKRSALTTFEAYVVSKVDGSSDVESLGKMVGLQRVEIQSLVHSLVDRGLLKMTPPPAVPAALRTTAPGGFELDRASVRTEPFRQAAPAGLGQKASLQEAIALEQKGDFKGAIKVLAKAIELSDQPASLYNRLALVVIKERRDFAMAENLLQKAVQLDPKREVFLKNLAFASKLVRTGRR